MMESTDAAKRSGDMLSVKFEQDDHQNKTGLYIPYIVNNDIDKR